MTNPDQLRHVFATFLGLPPDTDTPPVCGAVLTSDYNGRGKPDCITCGRVLAEWKRAEAAVRAVADAARITIPKGSR